MKIWIPAAIGSLGVILLLVFLYVFLTAGDDDPVATDLTRYDRRELLIPDDRFILPDAEERLLHPEVRFFLDPDEPLDRETLDAVQMDLREALRHELVPRIEQGVEELLFD